MAGAIPRDDDSLAAAIEAPFDGNDPEQVERRNQLIDFAQAKRLTAWLGVKRQLLATPEGRSWCWALLEESGVFGDKIALSGALYEQGFHSGKRQVGLGLMRILAQADPGAFAQMLAENDAPTTTETGNG